MPVDPYQLCPCGSGKKIKFCCHDLIGEMEKIYRMIEGDQPRAALRHVEQTLAKHPGRSSLLDLKASLQLSLDQSEEAKATVQEFLASDAKSPLAHAFDAIIKAEAGDPTAALEALQNALDYSEDLVPRRITDAMAEVAHALLAAGNIFAARNLLWMLDALAPQEDTRALEALRQIDRNLDLPLLLRDRYMLRNLPPGHPLADQMKRINQLGDNGRWRAAAELCDQILPDHLDEPLFIYNRALLSGYLADPKNCVAGLRLYARQDVPLGDAVEAEALAFLLDPAGAASLERVEVVRRIADEEALTDRLTRHPQIVSETVPPPEGDVGPYPYAMVTLLDRPLPDEDQQVTYDNLPRYQLTVQLFRRQTDQPERVAIYAPADRVEELLALFDSIAGDSLGEELSRTTVPYGHLLDHDPSDDLYYPHHVDSADRLKLAEEARREAIRGWADLPHPLLDQKSPREAAQIEELRLPTMACLLLLIQVYDAEWFADDLAALRSQLGFPEPEPIDGGKVDPDTLPLVSLLRLDLATVSTAQLDLYHRRSLAAQNRPVMRRVVNELLSRDDVDNHVKKSLYSGLILSQPNFDRAMELLEKVRADARSADENLAPWDLLEFRLNLIYGRSERTYELLEHLYNHHRDDPEVGRAIQEFLLMMGAFANAPGGHDHGHHAHSQHEPLEPEADPVGQIWTPGGDAPGGGGGSKIWTPD